MLNIGVLAFQGSVIEHLKMLSRLNQVNPLEVRSVEDLGRVTGLILPGGESTTIGKLLKETGLLEPMIRRIKDGMPVWGTCAGMILLAKEVVSETTVHLGVMDISVRRNAYGSQLDSFRTVLDIPEVSQEKVELVFIRAPRIESMADSVEIIARINGSPVAVRQNHMLATAFHPELTYDLSFHRYFIEMMNIRP